MPLSSSIRPKRRSVGTRSEDFARSMTKPKEDEEDSFSSADEGRILSKFDSIYFNLGGQKHFLAFSTEKIFQISKAAEPI